MKKTISLILALVMCLSLCACGGEKLSGKKLTSEKMAQLTIEAGLDALKKDGISEVFCENFRFYEAGDYSYIQTPLWYLTEEGVRYSQMVAQFNDTEMTNFAIDVMNNPFPDKSKGEENPEDAPEYAELFALCGGSATTMEATSELCNPVNVITFDEMIVRFGTQIAQKYTYNFRFQAGSCDHAKRKCSQYSHRLQNRAKIIWKDKTEPSRPLFARIQTPHSCSCRCR